MEKPEKADEMGSNLPSHRPLVSISAVLMVLAAGLSTAVLFLFQNSGQSPLLAAAIISLGVLAVLLVVRSEIGAQREGAQRSRAEAALREANERFKLTEQRIRKVIDFTHEAFIGIDATGTIADWNPQAAEIFGWQRDEIIGRKLVDTIVPPQHREGQWQGLEHFFETGQGPYAGKALELAALRRDGVEFPIELTFSRIRQADGFFFIAFARDITMRRLAEDSMKRSVARLRATLESTADGILVVDRKGKIVSFNEQFVKLWQIPERVLNSNNDDDAVQFVVDQLEDPEGFVSKVHALYKEPQAESFDVLNFKDGRIFERYSRPEVIDGEATGRVWSFRDVTSRERLIAELQQALADIKTLSGMIPICSWCKNVRDDEGYWKKVEDFVHAHSGATFSHSICPKCEEKFREQIPHAESEWTSR